MTAFLDASMRQARSLDRLEHRPWPLPRRPWTMGQSWNDLLFAHWRVDPELLRVHVPDAVELDLFDGAAWIGVTPFRVDGLRLRGLLPLPRVSSFLEVNVRTYVTAQGKPGIWFLSLDASSRVAVEAARRAYRLPYFHARISAGRRGDWIGYECERLDDPARRFGGRYRWTGEAREPQPDSLERFLVERYCLYTLDGGRLARAEIHHEPWPLQQAELELEANTMSPFELPEHAPLCHFSRRQDVVIWPLEHVGT